MGEQRSTGSNTSHNNFIFVVVKFHPSWCWSESILPGVATDDQKAKAGVKAGHFDLDKESRQAEVGMENAMNSRLNRR